jgi:benzoate-CoA ligase
MHATHATLPERFNFAHHLLVLNKDRHAKLAYRDDHHSLTYGELDQRVRCFAASLLAHGVKPEQRVLLVMLDTIDMPVAFLGALYAGVIPVPVNTLLPAENYAYMLEHSDAQLVIVSDALLPVVQQALQKSSHKASLLISGKADPAGAAFESFLQTMPLTEAANTHADQRLNYFLLMA